MRKKLITLCLALIFALSAVVGVDTSPSTPTTETIITPCCDRDDTV